MRGLYLTNDLMFSSKVTSLARERGWPLDMVMSPTALDERLAEGPAALAIVDLTWPASDLGELVRRIRQSSAGALIVAYGPHVDRSTLESAQQAGCDHVFSRGEFSQLFPAVLQKTLGA